MSKNEIDLNEVRTIEDLKKEILNLQRELKAAIITINKLMKDISQKTEQTEQLKTMLKNIVPVIKKDESKLVRIEITPEESIAEMQLEILRAASETRPLTLEEVRAFDILVKNKRLSQDQSTINLNKNDYKTVSNTDLLEIAGRVDTDGDQS